ncbi:S1-like domain-containing RNA-binding protein [Roseburia hominis]
MELGKKQVLTVVKKVEFGVYLGTEKEKVLLPRKQVPAGIEPGDPVEVFLYKDSSDRLIATTNEPKLTLGEAAVLKVVQVGKFGAFLDWGLEKDLFLPFKEQTVKVQAGEECVAALYIDKSQRLCATMKVYPYLRTDSPYQKDDRVEGIIYDSSRQFGMFVAVDGIYSALIPGREVPGGLKVGQRIQARVTEVKADGKLNLSVREKAFIQMDQDALLVLERMEKYGGRLPFNDKADAEVIKKEFGFSKNAFKRAVGHLYKERKIEIRKDSLVLVRK